MTGAGPPHYVRCMPITFASLVDDDGWVPMPLNQQGHPNYLWEDGRPLADAPVDFAATFDGAMWVTGKPIDVPAFYRNPLRVRANFMVPRHHHNIDETVFVLAGEYRIEYGDVDHPDSVLVRPGGFFTSRAGTPYTMIAGPEGVTYIETWSVPVPKLKTVCYDRGWIHR
jgi:mannose-6-phosphate isomerase-like protein (cupin superfamily)